MSSLNITKNYGEATRNLLWITPAWKKDTETINKSQEEMKNKTFELKNTVEGVKAG